MKRSIILTASFVLFLLALVMSSARATRAVKAADMCEDCLRSTQQRYEACEAALGGPNTICDEQFNRDIVVCYKFFCEQ